MKRWLKIMGAIAFVAILIGAVRIAYGLWDFSRPAVSHRKLARLNSEMDTNGVAKLLGTPTSSDVFTNEQGHVQTTWTYSRAAGWKFVTVCFGADGKFEQHYED